MTLRSIINDLWITGMVFQGCLCVVLLAKKAWRRFPLFTAYSLFSGLASITIYVVQRNPVAYFFSFWIGEAVAILLGFAVVYEIFRHLFSVHDALLKLAATVFRITIVVLFCVGLIVVLVHSPSDIRSVSKAVLVVEQATRIMEVGLLMFLFACSAAFGLHWRQSEFGMALGLGMFATVELTAVTLRSQVGPQAWELLNIVRIVGFNLSLIVWVIYLLAPERVTSSGEVPKRAQLEQWNQAVMELISQ